MEVIGYYTDSRYLAKILNKFLRPLPEFGHTAEMYRIKDTAQLHAGDLYILAGWRLLRDRLVTPKIIGDNRLLIADSFIRPLDCKQEGWKNDAYFTISRTLHCTGSKYIDLPSDRWDKYGVEVKPWNTTKKSLVVVSYGEDSIHGNNRENISRFKKCIKLAIEKGFDVVVCSHPEEVKHQVTAYKDASKIKEFQDLGCEFSTGGDKYLDEAACLISYPGSLNFKATIVGVPTYPVMDCYLSNLYTDCGIENLSIFLDKLPTPDRAKWLNWLAYQQWTPDEIEQGLAWEFMIENKNMSI